MLFDPLGMHSMPSMSDDGAVADCERGKRLHSIGTDVMSADGYVWTHYCRLR